MCGILGVVRRDGAAVDGTLLRRMRDTMLHRGPDDAGLYLSGGVGLAHRRLSIVDLSRDGHQPMPNEDGTIWLAFNGEIYNHVELAAKLAKRGHRFRSHCDTEVIIHLYEEVGDRCVHELNGMFSFVLWDSVRGQLFGARDRFGIKPFHYYEDSQQFICASEIKAILEDPSVRRAPDHRAIADLLFAGAPLGRKTLFESVCELPPAHTITVRDGRVSISEYWSVRYDYDERRSIDDVVDQLDVLLDDAVRMHCRSDAAVGSHLSGGLDSSTVAGYAARHVSPLNTFSIRFDGGSSYDESAYARTVARSLGTTHHQRTARPEVLTEIVAPLVWHMDQPPASGGDGGFSYYAAASLAAEHVKVALTGHGGDELFAGYAAQFRVAGLPWPEAPSRQDPARPGSRLWRLLGREGLTGIAQRLLRRLTPKAPARLEDLWIQLHCGALPSGSSLLSRDFRRSLGAYSPVDEYLAPFTHAQTESVLDRALHHDLRVYLPQLLHKEDRASMAVSIESRVPLLDHRIIEFLATVTPAQKTMGNLPKVLLRRAAARVVPPEIVARRDKVAFAVPIHHWLDQALAPLVRDVTLSPSCLDRGVFDADHIRRGLLEPGELLALLGIELWFRVHIDRDPRWCVDLDRLRARVSTMSTSAPERDVVHGVESPPHRRHPATPGSSSGFAAPGP